MVKIQPVTTDHIQSIVAIHQSAFFDGLLVKFGEKFLTDYYDLLIRQNFGYVALNQSESVIGFILITARSINVKKIIKISAVIKFMIACMKRPSIFFEFFSSLKNSHDKCIEYPENYANLSHIAVCTDFQGKGIGGILIKSIEKECKKRYFSGIYTRTHNYSLANYYKREKEAILIKNIYRGKIHSQILQWDI